MDSKTQVKKASVTGATGCKQPGKKKLKVRKSSRLNVFIYSTGGKSSSCHKLVHNYDESGTTNIGSVVRPQEEHHEYVDEKSRISKDLLVVLLVASFLGIVVLLVELLYFDEGICQGY
ncbi:hypothetical protein AVEN_245738-1 [Araneus ventricosus]|uniref:Uncharacterized protein n=1 Tax=Araneus ventricosus TaxID=182803 RepID=A0A4Y2QEY5_ARAVE|nr:hypothetical protein AVEN_245738-1 [Araneus ventricosus]